MPLSVPAHAPSRRALLPLLLVATLVVGLTWLVAERATGSPDRCAGFSAARQARVAADSGPAADPAAPDVARVAVIGDSYSVGLGLDDAAGSWPARLPGRVHVDGFSGSGFSEGASTCGRVSFADRAPAVAALDPDLVVVEGGLNDVDQPREAVAEGFHRLLDTLGERPVVVVGPADAPSRTAWVDGVDMQLAALCRQAGVPYLRMSNLDLTYLDDALHLTPAGHVVFGDAVAEGLAGLGGAGAINPPTAR